MYRKIGKRCIDLCLALFAFVVLLPLLVVLTISGTIAMSGNPFFLQRRPGYIDKHSGRERIFYLIKFRTMSNKKNSLGELLPDSERLNAYGRFLRNTSLDELPSLINIIKGDLAIVGPRPQLIRDMIFMSEEQRKRHSVRPGLTGLAQVNGRNNISWEQKFEYDLKYIEKITFFQDAKIIMKTILKVLKKDDVVRSGTSSDIDFGDWKLLNGDITQEEYYEILKLESNY